MKIQRVWIKNFRSIREAGFDLATLCALIGGNNSGKSNVLRALNIVLGERWPTARSFDERDFYGYREGEDLEIVIWFDEKRDVRGDVGDPVSFSGIKLRVTRYQKRSGKHERGDLRSEFTCVDDDGESVKILKQPPGRKSRPFPTPASVTQKIRDELPAVFIDVYRNANYHLSGSQWSILGRLLRDVSKDLKADKARYERFRAKFDEARVELRTPQFKLLENSVISQLEAHTGIEGVQVFLDDVDPLNLYKSFAVLFKDSDTPEPVDADRMGTGIQSAVVISLLQAYRELRKENAVLLFEEPELFLHPHGRRHLFKLLTDLADGGTQVIYTTHSQEFVDLMRLDCVRLTSRSADGGTAVNPPTDEILRAGWRDQLRIAKHFGAPRSEILFAESVVLVEGDTERATIRLLAELMPLGLDKLNCSVVEVGGKEGLPIMARIVRSLGKRLLVIHDTDSHRTDPTDVATNERRHEEIQEALDGFGELYTFDPYLEGALGLEGSGKKAKERRMREYLEQVSSWAELPELLKELMERVRVHAEGAQPSA